MRKYKITIVYKSGAVVKLRAKSFTVSKSDGVITEVEWNNPKPRPLHIGVDEIAAVWAT